MEQFAQDERSRPPGPRLVAPWLDHDLDRRLLPFWSARASRGTDGVEVDRSPSRTPSPDTTTRSGSRTHGHRRRSPARRGARAPDDVAPRRRRGGERGDLRRLARAGRSRRGSRGRAAGSAATASRQPRRPHQQSGPFGTAWTWPNSPAPPRAAAVRPRRSRRGPCRCPARSSRPRGGRARARAEQLLGDRQRVDVVVDEDRGRRGGPRGGRRGRCGAHSRRGESWTRPVAGSTMAGHADADAQQRVARSTPAAWRARRPPRASNRSRDGLDGRTRDRGPAVVTIARGVGREVGDGRRQVIGRDLDADDVAPPSDRRGASSPAGRWSPSRRRRRTARHPPARKPSSMRDAVIAVTVDGDRPEAAGDVRPGTAPPRSRTRLSDERPIDVADQLPIGRFASAVPAPLESSVVERSNHSGRCQAGRRRPDSGPAAGSRGLRPVQAPAVPAWA